MNTKIACIFFCKKLQISLRNFSKKVEYAKNMYDDSVFDQWQILCKRYFFNESGSCFENKKKPVVYVMFLIWLFDFFFKLLLSVTVITSVNIRQRDLQSVIADKNLVVMIEDENKAQYLEQNFNKSISFYLLITRLHDLTSPNLSLRKVF